MQQDRYEVSNVRFLTRVRDLHRDGKISLGEWLAKMVAATHMQSDQLMEFWNEFDIDGNGYLSKAEFVLMSDKMVQILDCEDRVKMLWSIFDRNGDGVLDGPEFRRMCNEMEFDAAGKQMMVRSSFIN